MENRHCCRAENRSDREWNGIAESERKMAERQRESNKQIFTMKFPMFMAHTERAFDNMVISLYMVLINGMFLAHIERAGAQRVRDIVVQRTPINRVLCQPLRIPIKMRREYTTNHLNK